MRHIVPVIMIVSMAWCSLGADTALAQDDNGGVGAVAVQSGRWVPARTSRAEPLQRKVSINLSGVLLTDALEAISRDAGLRLGYSGDVRRRKVRVSLKSDDMTVLSALLGVLEGTGFQPFISLRGDAVLVAAGAPLPPPASGRIVGRVINSLAFRRSLELERSLNRLPATHSSPVLQGLPGVYGVFSR